MAKVSIITRTKNRPITLIRALNSVANQTFTDYELIVVNDGGNRDDVEILIASIPAIKSCSKVIHNEVSVGMEAASNIGIINSSGDYILIHDDDDSLMPTFLEKTVGFLESDTANFYYGVATRMNQIKEEIVEDDIIEISNTLYQPSYNPGNLARMADSNQLVPISFLYKRSVHDVVGYYDEKLPVLGDWDFYLRFLSMYDICIIEEPLANYHVRTVSSNIYGNTITTELDKHIKYDALVRNKYIREAPMGYVGLQQLLRASSTNNDEYLLLGVIERLKTDKVKKISIYGTGMLAEKVSYLFTKYDIEILSFIESNPSLIGQSKNGIPIVSLDEADCRGDLDFFVASINYKDVIIGRIHEKFKDRDVRLRIYFCG